MKTIITILSLFHAITITAQIPEMSIRDSTLLKVIDIFLDSIGTDKIHSKDFAIGTWIDNLEVIAKPIEGRTYSQTLEWPHSEFQWSYMVTLRVEVPSAVTNFQIPSAKFRYKEKDVMIYFGAEYFVKYSDKDLRKLNRPGRIVRPPNIPGMLICTVRLNEIYFVKFVRDAHRVP